MIIGYDESTFSKSGKVWSKTVCYIRCDICGEKEWNTAWSNRKQRDHDYCQSCKNRMCIGGMKGRKHKPESIKKMKDNCHYGEDNPSKRPEVRKKISNALKDRDAYWLKDKKKPEHSKKMSEHMKEVWSTDNEYKRKLEDGLSNSRKKMKNGHGHSKLHTNFKQWMIENNIDGFVSEERVGEFIVDEINQEKKIIIEINGDYWHCNPKLYESNQIVKFPYGECTANSVWEKDNNRINKLESLGYKVIVFWESDIKSGNIDLEVIRCS